MSADLAQHQDLLAGLARRSARRRAQVWPTRRLTPGTRVLLWALRAYVVAMLAVVVVQLIRLA